MTKQINGGGLRSARMLIRSAILMSSGGSCWTSEIENISATGVLVRRPEDWAGRIGDIYALDMLFGDTLDIHVEARLARMADAQLGFTYARIPEDKEAPLWSLLGGYADRLEPYPQG